MPFFLSSFERFRKKLTVIGIIGQMQGIATASRPPTKPISRIYHSEWFAMSSPLPIARSSEMTGVQREEAPSNLPPLGEAMLSVLRESLGTLSAAKVFSSFSISFWESSLPSPFGEGSGERLGLFPLAFSAASPGGRHISSLHAPHST